MTSPPACPRAITEQKQRVTRLGSDLSSAQKEMKSKHKAYESAVSILSRRLQEALTAKEAAEAELSQLRAQAASGASSLTMHVRTTFAQPSAALRVGTRGDAGGRLAPATATWKPVARLTFLSCC